MTTTNTVWCLLAASSVALMIVFLAAVPRKSLADRKRQRAELRDRLGLLPPIPERTSAPMPAAEKRRGAGLRDLLGLTPKVPNFPPALPRRTKEQEREDLAREIRRWD